MKLTTKKKLRPFYQDENVTIYCGDCREVLPLLGEDIAELALTDPPYGVRTDLAWDPTSNRDDLAKLSRVVADLLTKAVKRNGSLFWFADAKRAWEVEAVIREVWQPLNQLVWNKPSGRWCGARKEGLRQFFPRTERILFCEQRPSKVGCITNQYYYAACNKLHGELMKPLWSWFRAEKKRIGISNKEIQEGMFRETGKRFMFVSHSFRPNQFQLPTPEQYRAARKVFTQYWRANRSKGRKPLQRDYRPLQREYEPLKKQYDKIKQEYQSLRRPFFATKNRQHTDVIECAVVQPHKGKHPCEKPLELLKRLIEVTTHEGGTIIDPFAGSGSTGFAAIGLGRKAILIEQDQVWCKKIVEQYKAMVA